MESVLILGKAVQVDFLDERKFAAAASALGRTAQQVLELVHRQSYSEDPGAGWSRFRDGRFNAQTGRTRYWGADAWASRGIQGAFYNWITGNALVPEVDTVNEGIQKIDRSTVPELDELARLGESLQVTVDNMNARVNPLGLSPCAVSFDLSSSEWEGGQTHFEQIFERATAVLENAFRAFNRAVENTRFLRTQEGTLDDFQEAVFDEERAFKNELIDIYGTALPGDIGPGKLYATGFDGPDTVKYRWIQQPSQFFLQEPNTSAEVFVNLRRPFTLLDISLFEGTMDELFGDDTTVDEAFFSTVAARLNSFQPGLGDSLTANGEVDLFDLKNSFFDRVFDPSLSETVGLHIDFGQDVQFADPEDGQRVTPGKLQQALLRQVMTRHRLLQMIDEFDDRRRLLDGQIAVLNEAVAAFLPSSEARILTGEEISSKNSIISGLKAAAEIVQKVKKAALKTKLFAAITGLPKAVGFSPDLTFSLRGSLAAASGIISLVGNAAIIGLKIDAARLASDVKDLKQDLGRELLAIDFGPGRQRMIFELGEAFDNFLDTTFEIDASF